MKCGVEDCQKKPTVAQAVLVRIQPLGFVKIYSFLCDDHDKAQTKPFSIPADYEKKKP